MVLVVDDFEAGVRTVERTDFWAMGFMGKRGVRPRYHRVDADGALG